MNSFDLLIVDNEMTAIADLIAQCLPAGYRASLEIDILLLQPVSGFPIDAIETDFLARR